MAPSEPTSSSSASENTQTSTEGDRTTSSGENSVQEQPPSEKPKAMHPIYAPTKLITVVVGKNEVEFGIHESILTSKSLLFKKCLAAGMQETQERTMKMPEDNSAVFEIVVDWLYSGTLKEDALSPPLVNAYTLADKLCMPGLQNTVVDAMLAHPIMCPRRATWAWENVPEGGKMRLLILDTLHYYVRGGPSKYKRLENGQDPDHAVAFEELSLEKDTLGLALFWATMEHGMRLGMKLPQNPGNKGRCFYHEHPDGKSCQ